MAVTGSRVRGWPAFAAATFALFVLLLGSNLPTPLFPVYAKEYGLSPLGVSLVFATYALMVIPALILFGSLSDAKGRRETLVPAILLAAGAAALFAAAQSTRWLLAAQVVQAIALGALQGSAAPTLIENDPSGETRRASAIASATTVAGTAAGPLLAGALAQWGPLPERLPYLFEFGLLAVALVAVVVKLPARRDRDPWHPRLPAVPAEIRRAFAVAATSAFASWAVIGLFLSLIPSFMEDSLGVSNLASIGAVVTLMLGCATLVQLVAFRFASLAAQRAGFILMIAGLALLGWAAHSERLSFLLGATVVAGVGEGLSFMGSLGDIGEIAPEDRKANTVAAYYIAVYLGTALPVVGVGILATQYALLSAVQVFTCIIGVLCVAGLALLTAEARARSST